MSVLVAQALDIGNERKRGKNEVVKEKHILCPDPPLKRLENEKRKNPK